MADCVLRIDPKKKDMDNYIMDCFSSGDEDAIGNETGVRGRGGRRGRGRGGHGNTTAGVVPSNNIQIADQGKGARSKYDTEGSNLGKDKEN